MTNAVSYWSASTRRQTAHGKTASDAADAPRTMRPVAYRTSISHWI